ncbi:MAG: RidA family protein [Candidatus Promineifilaceae bacterium]
MPKQTVNPPELFDSLQYGFSQMVVSSGGQTVHLSGQVAWDENQNIVGDGDLEAQTQQTFKNIDAALKLVGATLDNVVSMRIYIVAEQMAHSGHVSTALRAWFSAETAPATTWIGVHSLARPEFLIEIEAIAVID